MSSSIASTRTAVSSHLAPQAIGPYSQAMKIGNMLFCAGQVAIDPVTQQLIDGDILAQTRRILENTGALLRAARMSYEHVVHCRISLVNMRDYAQVNEVYSEYFNYQPPCRETMQVVALPRGALIALSCIAIE